MAAIQLILAVLFFFVAVRSYQAIHAHADGLPLTAELVMPVLFVVAGAIALRAALGNVRGARSLWHRRKSVGTGRGEDGDSDGHI